MWTLQPCCSLTKLLWHFYSLDIWYQFYDRLLNSVYKCYWDFDRGYGEYVGHWVVWTS